MNVVRAWSGNRIRGSLSEVGSQKLNLSVVSPHSVVSLRTVTIFLRAAAIGIMRDIYVIFRLLYFANNREIIKIINNSTNHCDHF